MKSPKKYSKWDYITDYIFDHLLDIAVLIVAFISLARTFL